MFLTVSSFEGLKNTGFMIQTNAMLQPLYFRVKMAAQPVFNRVEFADSFFDALQAHFVNHPEVSEFDANGRIITSKFRTNIADHLDNW